MMQLLKRCRVRFQFIVWETMDCTFTSRGLLWTFGQWYRGTSGLPWKFWNMTVFKILMFMSSLLCLQAKELVSYWRSRHHCCVCRPKNLTAHSELYFFAVVVSFKWKLITDCLMITMLRCSSPACFFRVLNCMHEYNIHERDQHMKCISWTSLLRPSWKSSRVVWQDGWS